MRETVYLETTVVSYYTSRPSRDIIVLAHQEITCEWWPIATKRFDIFISEVVIEEAKQGDPIAARKRLEALKSFPNLELNMEVEKIAKIYMKRLYIPQKAIRDAAHLSIASVHKIDYFVTWNCNHIANGENIKRLILKSCAKTPST